MNDLFNIFSKFKLNSTKEIHQLIEYFLLIIIALVPYLLISIVDRNFFERNDVLKLILLSITISFLICYIISKINDAFKIVFENLIKLAINLILTYFTEIRIKTENKKDVLFEELFIILKKSRLFDNSMKNIFNEIASLKNDEKKQLNLFYKKLEKVEKILSNFRNKKFHKNNLYSIFFDYSLLAFNFIIIYFFIYTYLDYKIYFYTLSLFIIVKLNSYLVGVSKILFISISMIVRILFSLISFAEFLIKFNKIKKIIKTKQIS